MPVQGDPCGIDGLSRSIGGRASTAQTQATNFGTALSTLPPTNFAGGKADKTRDFAGQLQAASARAARVYDRIASYLPRVSRAIDEAQQAEQRLDKATTDLQTAQTEVTAATTALDQARAAAHSYDAAGHLINQALAQSAISAAEQRLRTAQQHLDTAQRAERKAHHDFDEANRTRGRLLDTFSSMCDDAASELDQHLPTPPPNETPQERVLDYLLQSPRDQIGALRQEAGALRNLPTILAVHRVLPTSIHTLQQAMRAQNWRYLDAVTPHFRQLSPTAPDLGGHHRGPLQQVGHFASDLLDGTKDGTVGTVTSLYQLGKISLRSIDVFNPRLMMAQREQNQQMSNDFVYSLLHDPIGTAGNLVGANDARHHPGHFVGNLVPTLLEAAGTDGLSESLKGTQATQKYLDTYEQVYRSAAKAPGADPLNGVVANKLAQRSAQLQPKIDRLKKADDARKVEGRVGQVAGVTGYLQDAEKASASCQPYPGDGLVPGTVAGKAVPKVRGHFK